LDDCGCWQREESALIKINGEICGGICGEIWAEIKLQTAITFDTNNVWTRKLIHVEENVELYNTLSNEIFSG